MNYTWTQIRSEALPYAANLLNRYPETWYTADDLAQYVLESLCKDFPAPAEGISVESHSALRTIIRRRCIDALREWRAPRRSERVQPVPLSDTLAAGHEPPVDAMLDARSSLSALPERNHAAVVASAFGYNAAEIGKGLGVSRSTATKLVADSKQALKAGGN